MPYIRDWTECLKDVLYEARIIYEAGLQLTEGEPLNQEDSQRLNLAMKRIESAGRMFNGIA